MREGERVLAAAEPPVSYQRWPAGGGGEPPTSPIQPGCMPDGAGPAYSTRYFACRTSMNLMNLMKRISSTLGCAHTRHREYDAARSDAQPSVEQLRVGLGGARGVGWLFRGPSGVLSGRTPLGCVRHATPATARGTKQSAQPRFHTHITHTHTHFCVRTCTCIDRAARRGPFATCSIPLTHVSIYKMLPKRESWQHRLTQGAQ